MLYLDTWYRGILTYMQDIPWLRIIIRLTDPLAKSIRFELGIGDLRSHDPEAQFSNQSGSMLLHLPHSLAPQDTQKNQEHLGWMGLEL